MVRPGEPVPQDQRPFYESVYIPRIAIPYHERAKEDPQSKYEEVELIRSLEEGRGFVLLGPPLDGKSRTLYELVNNMVGHEVVVPKPNERVPDEKVFSSVLKNKQVVLLLDDLTRYADAEVDLGEFWDRLNRHASSRVIASTCRDGPELSAVRDAPKQSLRWFYDQIPLRLSLLKARSEEKRRLAEAIGAPQEGHHWEEFPHLGHVAMEDPMNQMRGRFERLSHQSPEQRDALRALKLLAAAGVLPFTQERVRGIMRGLFGRSPAHLGDCLDALAEQSFLSPDHHDPVMPEPAYLRYVVAYSAGSKEPEDDFPNLADVFENLKDHEGLRYLGLTYALDLEDYEKARACLNRAVHIGLSDPQAWLRQAEALHRLGSHQLVSGVSNQAQGAFEEALDACEEAIRLGCDFPKARIGKATVLVALQRYQEAVDALDEAINLNPDLHDPWCRKGAALNMAGCSQEAIGILDEAIRLKPDCLRAWANRGLRCLNWLACGRAKNSPGMHRQHVFGRRRQNVIRRCRKSLRRRQRHMRRPITSDPTSLRLGQTRARYYPPLDATKRSWRPTMRP